MHRAGPSRVPSRSAWRLSWGCRCRFTTSEAPDIRSIDLNADLGEHDGDRYSDDEQLLAVVSSASIACGAHAGNADVMEETARRAAGHGVAVGAHPSYPDRHGFGRRDLDIPLSELADSFRAQVDLMMECATRAGTIVSYVKPHGALYNRAMRDAELANVLVETIHSLALLALPGSALSDMAMRRGLPVAREAFMDRAYMHDGTLVPRSMAGAVIHDADEAARRALRIAREKSVESRDGTIVRIEADSLCVHSDSRDSLAIVTAARAALEGAGFVIRSFA